MAASVSRVSQKLPGIYIHFERVLERDGGEENEINTHFEVLC